MEIVDEYRDRITTVISEPDKGIYDAMNKGIALATGDIVGILNSDDFYENSSVIESIVDHFKAHPDSDLAFGNIVFETENVLKADRIIVFLIKKDSIESLLFGRPGAYVVLAAEAAFICNKFF